MSSPEDRPPWQPVRPQRPAQRVVNAATMPIASQRPPAPASPRAYEPPTQPNPVPRGPAPVRRPTPPQAAPRPAPYPPQGPPRHYVQRPEQYIAPPAQQFPPAADPYPFDPPRITTTQRPHRRVDTSVLCAAAALVLLGVAVLVGVLL
ncbi:hypothetical protein [Williamsia limnetica]|uniref:hypothetical protein n=1 Tax=Williamsia limnetica TaxID=882452 RepID=UPI0011B3A100|nr:hypothetical protein [Williamsia limnetica]